MEDAFFRTINAAGAAAPLLASYSLSTPLDSPFNSLFEQSQSQTKQFANQRDHVVSMT
jgi:hypothetical protein